MAVREGGGSSGRSRGEAKVDEWEWLGGKEVNTKIKLHKGSKRVLRRRAEQS